MALAPPPPSCKRQDEDGVVKSLAQALVVELSMELFGT